MIVVFIGTGIGGALFFDGKLYRGSSFFAGEIGHMLVDSKGGFLKKKRSSTFENNASRTAIVRKIKKDLAKDKPSILNEYSSPNKALKSRALSEALEKKDPLAVKHIGKAARTIGTVLGSITTLLNIDTIVLGGGVIEAMEKFMVPRITEAYHESVLPEPGKDVKIVATKLGDDAALYGGVALADEFLVKK
jgi:glucokinase